MRPANRSSALMLAGLVSTSCADAPAPLVLPPPVAGLAHPAVVRAGIPVVFDAGPTRVAVVKNRPDLSATLRSLRFAAADGSAAVDQAQLQWSHTFAQPGTYDVSLAVWDDRGATSTARSQVLVVADLAAACTGTSDAACDTGLCTAGACVKVACAGPVACEIVGAGAACTAGQCVKAGP